MSVVDFSLDRRSTVVRLSFDRRYSTHSNRGGCGCDCGWCCGCGLVVVGVDGVVVDGVVGVDGMVVDGVVGVVWLW